MAAGSFVFDANRCTGCGACRVACTIENALAPDVSWRRIDTFNPRHHPIAPVFHLSLACNHCGDAACMNACPALAYRRDAPTGAVLLDTKRCIGCGYCAWACPYDAPVFDESTGVMTKCTWCVDRLRIGLKPACATHCPTGALDHVGGPVEARVQAMEGLPVPRLDPNLHVIPLKPDRTQPEMFQDDARGVPGAAVPGARFEVPGPAFGGTTALSEPGTRHLEPGTPHPAPGTGTPISVRHDWPLAVFTLAAATLVGVLGGAATGAFEIDPWAFTVGAATTLIFASTHLGRPLRAWRASLHLRRSWLSREVVTLSSCFALATVWLVLVPDNRVFGWITVATGFAGLFAADRLYGVLPSGPGYRHSASMFWTGLLLVAVAARQPELAGLAGLARLAMYARQRVVAAAHGRPLQPLMGTARAALMLAALAMVFVPELVPEFASGWPAAFVLALGGDVVDRLQYYLELERETPRRQMDIALARRLEPNRVCAADGAVSDFASSRPREAGRSRYTSGVSRLNRESGGLCHRVRWRFPIQR